MYEQWKDILGFEGVYQVSIRARVRSLDRVDCAGRNRKGRVLKSAATTYGHLMVVLCKDGVCKSTKIHKLVAEAFLGPCPVGKEVCHGSKGKDINTPDNLRYGTRSDNQQDRNNDGNSGAKAVIRSDGVGFISIRQAGRATGCGASHIGKCCAGKKNYQTVGGFGWKFK